MMPAAGAMHLTLTSKGLVAPINMKNKVLVAVSVDDIGRDHFNRPGFHFYREMAVFWLNHCAFKNRYC
jgi:hypothetical protein